MENINSGDDSDHDLISTEMLEDICDVIQTHLNVNRKEARYKIRVHIRQRQSEWKGALKDTQSIGKGLHKVFSMVVKAILQQLTPLGESGSEVSHFIPEPKNFAEVTKLSENIKKPWLKANLKEINNIINNHNFLFLFLSFGLGHRDQIACSLLGGFSQAHNSGYQVTRLCPM